MIPYLCKSPENHCVPVEWITRKILFLLETVENPEKQFLLPYCQIQWEFSGWNPHIWFCMQRIECRSLVFMSLLLSRHYFCCDPVLSHYYLCRECATATTFITDF